VLYGCETWTLTLREECRLREFENRILRKIFRSKVDKNEKRSNVLISLFFSCISFSFPLSPSLFLFYLLFLLFPFFLLIVFFVFIIENTNGNILLSFSSKKFCISNFLEEFEN
jgi:hypothetical protein